MAGALIFHHRPGQAQRAARDVLAQQSLTADFRFECWAPDGQTWRDVRAGPSDAAAWLPAEDKGKRGRRRAAKLIDNVILPYIDQIPPI